jgi:hypothetical protein
MMPKRSWCHRLGAVTSPTTLNSDISSAFPSDACDRCHAIPKVRNATFEQFRFCSMVATPRFSVSSNLVYGILYTGQVSRGTFPFCGNLPLSSHSCVVFFADLSWPPDNRKHRHALNRIRGPAIEYCRADPEPGGAPTCRSRKRPCRSAAFMDPHVVPSIEPRLPVAAARPICWSITILYSISDISNTQRTINYTQRAINPI